MDFFGNTLLSCRNFHNFDRLIIFNRIQQRLLRLLLVVDAAWFAATNHGPAPRIANETIDFSKRGRMHVCAASGKCLLVDCWFLSLLRYLCYTYAKHQLLPISAQKVWNTIVFRCCLSTSMIELADPLLRCNSRRKQSPGNIGCHTCHQANYAVASFNLLCVGRPLQKYIKDDVIELCADSAIDSCLPQLSLEMEHKKNILYESRMKKNKTEWNYKFAKLINM